MVVWFSSQLDLSNVRIAFDHKIDKKVFERASRSNFVDDLVLEKLQALNLEPSPRCDDATFIRRAFLDSIGVLPTVDEVTNFLADDSENKRTTLVDSLLEREEFVDYWTYRWSDVFLINGKRLRPGPVKAYYQWLARADCQERSLGRNRS